MKTNRSSRSPWPLFATMPVLLLGVFAFAIATSTPAHAQVVISDGLLFAQVTPPVDPSPVVVVAETPWYADGAVISGFIAFVTGVFAVFQNTKLSKAQKLNGVLVLGLEAATKIPKVAEFEKKIKGDIKAKAEELGVQPLLDRIVQDIT